MLYPALRRVLSPGRGTKERDAASIGRMAFRFALGGMKPPSEGAGSEDASLPNAGVCKRESKGFSPINPERDTTLLDAVIYKQYAQTDGG